MVLAFIYWGWHFRIKNWRMIRFNIVIIYDTWTFFCFSKTFYKAKRFFASRLMSGGFRCKPLLPRFLTLIFLLSIMSISSWRRWLVNWLNCYATFPSSARKLGVKITTLQLVRLSVIKDLRVRRVSNIFRDVNREHHLCRRELWRSLFHAINRCTSKIVYINNTSFPAQSFLYDAI